MRNQIFWIFVWCLSLTGSTAWGNPDDDKIYGLRKFAVAVINTDQDPVYCDHVENELVRYIKSTPRFELSREAYISFKDSLSSIYLNDPTTPTRDKLEWIRPQIQRLAEKDVDAVFVAEVYPFGNNYKISLTMATTNKMELILFEDAIVEDRYNLASFSYALLDALSRIEKRLPFDGSVVRRDGFRIVLDRADPDLKPGQNVTIYTLEKSKTSLDLVETGLVTITDVGERVSFGSILVENRPREISARNKILLSGEVSRDPAAIGGGTFLKRNLGSVDVQLGGGLVTMNNVAANGAGASTANNFFPTGRFNGEVWMTTRTFLQLAIDFAFASVSGGSTDQNSNVSDIRGQVGYKFIGDPNGTGPSFHVRAGYARHSVGVDASTDPLTFNSIRYAGLFAGGGFLFKMNQRYGVGLDVNTLLMPSVSESPLTSGDTISAVTGWDFTVHGYYHFNEVIDFVARLNFHAYSAEFSGATTRPIPITSSSQSGRSLTVGVSYHF